MTPILMPEIEQARANHVAVTEDLLTITLTDGRQLSVPVNWYPRLWHGTLTERNQWELMGQGSGIHWPTLDEDLSVSGLLLGRKSGESARSLQKWLDQRQAAGKPARSSE